MAVFSWDESLTLGIDEIDSQHKNLLNKMNNLAEAVLQRKGKDKIGNLLKFMENYADLHFKTEEEYMARNAYSGLAHQRKEHEQFKSVVEKLYSDLDREGVSEGFAIAVQRYLMDWFILHIKEKDLEFSNFLKNVEE
jgi:hemerythrin